MEDYIVEEVLKKIVDIDKKRSRVEEEMLDLKAEHEENLQKKIKKLQRQVMKETRTKAKKKIQEMNVQTDQEEKDILDKGNTYLEMMDENFEKMKDLCIQEIMDNMFNKK